MDDEQIWNYFLLNSGLLFILYLNSRFSVFQYNNFISYSNFSNIGNLTLNYFISY